jgi:hypothetical protein
MRTRRKRTGVIKDLISFVERLVHYVEVDCPDLVVGRSSIYSVCLYRLHRGLGNVDLGTEILLTRMVLVKP